MHEYYGRVDATPDQEEGLQAFAEKRRPRYSAINRTRRTIGRSADPDRRTSR